MSKKQHIVKLVGILKDGSVASTQQADQVVAFVDRLKDPYFMVAQVKDERRLVLTTPKGVYHVGKSLTVKNLYQGQANGHKVHISLKKLVGKVIYWA